jgi:UDP-N-acetylglucosamine diphosphorylase/glucosamine-1-phosphate N-acetyltransferase
MSNKLIITILAAGEGKRMNSDIPKVLHMFKDKPMLARIVQSASSLNPQKIIIVTGKHHILIRDTLTRYIDINSVHFVNQQVPNGTGDAIKTCLPLYHGDSLSLILNGDMPLINKTLLEKFIENSYQANILVAKFENPTGYGRIVYDSNREFTEIVEEKDCTEEQRKINVINSGIYLIDSKLLKKYVPMIDNNNAQKEYYLTDIVKLIKQNTDISIDTYLIEKDENKFISGVNTQLELTKLELLS